MKTSLELDDDDKLDVGMLFAGMDKPDYPCGLRICLTDSEFRKLRIDPTEAFVDGTFDMEVTVKVTCVTKTNGPNGECHRVEGQIIAAEVEDWDEESEDTESDEDAT